MDKKRKLDSENFENKRPATNTNDVFTSSSSSSLPVEDAVLKYNRICTDLDESNMDTLRCLNENDLWMLNKHCYLHNLPGPVIISIGKGNYCTSSHLIELCGNSKLSVTPKDEDGDDIDCNEFFYDVRDHIFSKSMELACELNQITIVELLFQKHAVYHLDSALAYATRKGNIDIVKLILQKNDHDFDCSKAAMIAVEGGFLDIFMLFSDFVINELGGLLRIAAKHGHMNIIKFIIAKRKLKRGYDNVWYCINDALIAAVSGGHREIIDLLLDEGANQILDAYAEAIVNGHMELSTYLLTFVSRENYLMDQVHHAMRKVASVGNVTAIIKSLLDFLVFPCPGKKSAHNELKMHCINTAIAVAAEHGHLDTVAFLLSQGANALTDALLSAASKGHDDVVKQFLTAGAMPERWTLKSACRNGHLSTVQLLLTVLRDKDRKGYSPGYIEVTLNETLMKAITEGHTMIVKHLIDVGHLSVTYDFLKDAVRYNRIETFQCLLNLRQSGTSCDELNELMLIAAAKGNLTIVDILIAKGAVSYNAALKLALDNNRRELIKPLVHAGATQLNDTLMSLSTTDRKVNHAMNQHINKETLDIAKFLIDAGATNLNEAFVKATTCLNLDLMKVLIEAGADDLNLALFSLQSVPIYYSHQKIPALTISKYLLSRGANPFIPMDQNDKMNTAFTHCNDKGNFKVLRHFLASALKSRYTAMIHKGFVVSTKKSYFESVELYLDHELDVNKVYAQSFPLVSAAESTNIAEAQYKTAQLLLERGADVNSQTKLGKTALIAAIKTKKYLRFIQLLIENGAILDLKDFDNRTALYWAAITKCNDQIEKVQYLLERGADGRDLAPKKAYNKSLEELIPNSQVLELIKASNDAKPLYYCK